MCDFCVKYKNFYADSSILLLCLDLRVYCTLILCFCGAGIGVLHTGFGIFNVIFILSSHFCNIFDMFTIKNRNGIGFM